MRAAEAAGRGSVNGNFKLKFRISLETNTGTFNSGLGWEGGGQPEFK